MLVQKESTCPMMWLCNSVQALVHHWCLLAVFPGGLQGKDLKVKSSGNWAMKRQKKGPHFVFWGECDFLLAYQSFSNCAFPLYISENQRHSPVVWLGKLKHRIMCKNLLNFGDTAALSPLGAVGHFGSDLSPQVIGSTRAGVVAFDSQAGITTSKKIKKPER